MGTIQPRARGGASLSETLKARRLREEQLGRQRVDIPKPPKAVASSGGVWASAESTSVATVGGYPSFTGWTFYDDAIGLGADVEAQCFTVPPGLYMAKIYLQINVSPVQSDLWVSANIFSSSAYVTHEMPLHVDPSGHYPGSHTIGPLPVAEGQGRLSVSFLFRESAGVPTVTGSCAYILAKIG